MAIAQPTHRRPPGIAAATARTPISDRVLAWRDHLVASPRFQRAAARFLPTRWIARRRAQALFDLVAGFTYSQVLLACVRLGLFDLLLERPRSRAEIAALAVLDEAATERLLTAAVSLRLIERRSGRRYGLGPLGVPMAGNAAIAAMVEHHSALYADLADPVALLRRRPSTGETTRLGDVWGYAANGAAAALDDSRVAGYSALMTASQPLVADQVLDAYPLAAHRCLLDVGGGEGAFALAVARRHPHLAVKVFDLPAVAARARARLDREGHARIETFGGDFARDPLPVGADIVTLVRVVHDHDDDRALAILEAVHAALSTGGVLLLAEPMSGTRGAEPMGDAYFGMYLLAMGSGRARTPDELAAMLSRAGFARSRLISTALPLQARVIVATK
ncbi:MAG: methyltransferase [Burkholderiaceae bacterium]